LSEFWIFDELFGEDRLCYFAPTMAARRHDVAFRFLGWKNIDRLINEPSFRKLAHHMVGNNVTFGFFAFPDDIGVHALLRAWWLDSHPRLNLKSHYQHFVKDAVDIIVYGTEESAKRMRAPGIFPGMLAYQIEETFRADLLKREGRLNLQLK